MLKVCVCFANIDKGKLAFFLRNLLIREINDSHHGLLVGKYCQKQRTRRSASNKNLINKLFDQYSKENLLHKM